MLESQGALPSPFLSVREGLTLNPGRPRAYYVDQDATELTEILLFLPPGLDLKACATTSGQSHFLKHFCLAVLGTEPRALCMPFEYCIPASLPLSQDKTLLVSRDQLEKPQHLKFFSLYAELCANLSLTQACF